ncbi:hypothetical protein ACFW04_007858 [Cataglyphis niger]
MKIFSFLLQLFLNLALLGLIMSNGVFAEANPIADPEPQPKADPQPVWSWNFPRK